MSKKTEEGLEKKVAEQFETRVIYNPPVSEDLYVGYVVVINPFFEITESIKDVYYHVFRIKHTHRTIK